ncbi:MAG: M23 family metallopeptidase [Bacteroidales bacterium]|nr:M23 family metallopeptidase [Candidatus Cryptobacteroides onthequi]MCQ2165411.1 M23 family metallopeptidase [Bacteroidales bacterium]
MAKSIKDKTNIFRATLSDEETQKTLMSKRFTRFGFWFMTFASAVVACLLAYCLFAFTPLRHTIPGYPGAKSRNEAVRNAIRIDSLETIINRWEFYAENLRRVVDGQAPVNIDSLIRRDVSDSAVMASSEELAQSDTLLRRMVSQNDRRGTSEAQGDLTLEGRHFFAPVKGTVSKAFDQLLHPYLELTAPAGSTVLSVLEGTVIFSGWNDESGYTIGIQHPGDIVSIYRQNQKLLKGIGDHVSAGTPVGLAGDVEEQAGGNLHFEIWYKGALIDPALYISF